MERKMNAFEKIDLLLKEYCDQLPAQFKKDLQVIINEGNYIMPLSEKMDIVKNYPRKEALKILCVCERSYRRYRQLLQCSDALREAVERKEIAYTSAIELSKIPEEQQKMIVHTCKINNKRIDKKICIRFKKAYQHHRLCEETIMKYVSV